MSTEEKKASLSRRDFLKSTGGLASLAAVIPFSTEAKAAAEKRGQEIRKKSELSNIESPIQIDPKTFKRFKQTDNAFFHPSTMMQKNRAGKMVPWPVARDENCFIAMKKGDYGTHNKGTSVAEARSAFALSKGLWSNARINGFKMENRGSLSWTPLNVPDFLAYRAPDETDPDVLTTQVKFAARQAGADLVGIAPLNRNWVYTNAMLFKDGVKKPKGPQDLIYKNIVFKDVEQPQETETELIIPDSCNNVIVSAFAQNRELLQTPGTMAEASVGMGYSRSTMHDQAVCDYIRAMGYIAIPTVNTTAQSVPMAIEAGLGEGSRMGLLITPEYGPNVRISKIFTNMPLNHDKPIEFGAKKFCETCKKCARECPSKCLTEGEPSFTPRTLHSQPGKLQWQNDYNKCLNYWVENGSSCAICMATCPFTKGNIWIHDGVEWLIKNASFLDPFMLGMDDALRYAEERDPKEVWNGETNTYGLDTDHFQDTKESYGGKKS